MAVIAPLSAVEQLPRLAATLDVPPEDLLVLREDLLGIAGGGNKVRKALAALRRAADDGVRTVVTTGAPQSNHARAVAVIGAQLGLDVVLVLEGDDPGTRRGNTLLEELAGARLVWSRDRELADVAAEEAAAAAAPARVVPFGGSDAAAVEVYAEVGRHLDAAVPDLRHVVVAVGSGATAAGLVAALGPERVLAVDCGAVPDARATLTHLLSTVRPVDPGSLRLDSGRVGSGYEHVQPPVLAAVQDALRLDGVLFDVTYAGRALAGAIAGLRSGELPRGERVLVVHTGGVPGLFGHPELDRPRLPTSGPRVRA